MNTAILWECTYVPKLFKRMQIFKCIYFYDDPKQPTKRRKKKRNKQLDFVGKITLGVFDHQICASYEFVQMLSIQGDLNKIITNDYIICFGIKVGVI